MIILALNFLGIVFILLINVKMPTTVGILTFYEQDKFCAQLSWAWKKFYNFRAWILWEFPESVAVNNRCKQLGPRAGLTKCWV